MTRAEFAQWFDVSERTVRDWVNKGLPRTGTGQKARYTFASAKWAREYQASQNHNGHDLGSLTEEQTRKIKIDADRAELKLARERGLVVAVSDARQAIEQVASNIRARLTQIPAKLTQRLWGCEDRQRFKATIEGEIADCLRELVSKSGRIELDSEKEGVD